MCSDRSRFREYIQNDENNSLHLGKERYGNGEHGPIIGYGKVSRFEKVLHAPDLDADIVISVG